MKTITILTLLFIAIPLAKSQETILYNARGVLKFDSAYSINPKYLRSVAEIERSVHNIYREIEYPWKAAENHIGGIVIAKIHVDNAQLGTWCEIVKCTDPSFKEPVEKAVQRNSLTILRRTKGMDNFIFYLPFKFEVTATPILEDMKENKAIRIKSYRLLPVVVPL